MFEQLELMIADTKAEIEKHKGQGVSTDTQQKRTLRMQVRRTHTLTCLSSKGIVQMPHVRGHAPGFLCAILSHASIK